MVDSRTREEPRACRRSGRSAAGGRRVQQAPPRRRPKRRHGILFKLYVFLVICSAIVVGLYIAHELLVQPPAIPQSETTAPDTEDTALPVADPEDPNALVRRDGVYNFVLLGKDVDSSNTDTIILVSFDTAQGKIGMISIPRDTAVNRTWTTQTAKLNYAYHNGGADVLMDEIQQTFGVPVDYYIHVDLKGFIALVDELGGVDIEIPLDMNYDDPVQGLHIHFSAGYQHLDGQETMEAVRYRHDNESSPNYWSNQWYSDVQRGRVPAGGAHHPGQEGDLLELPDQGNFLPGYLQFLRGDQPVPHRHGLLCRAGHEAGPVHRRSAGEPHRAGRRCAQRL